MISLRGFLASTLDKTTFESVFWFIKRLKIPYFWTFPVRFLIPRYFLKGLHKKYYSHIQAILYKRYEKIPS